MSGILYGVGVGPGDPGLLTLNAVKVITEAEIIAVPGEEKENSVAYQIAKQAVSGMDKKTVISIYMPMTKDRKRLEESHEAGAGILCEYLEEGKNVAFLTLGDPTIYSTYIYLHTRVLGRGYRAEIISGIPSFCAAAAKINQGLVEKNEMLHIIPSSYEIEDALKLPGTRVLMKAGKKMEQVKEALVKHSCNAIMIENCGMENEKVYNQIDEIPNDSSYYSLIIVKES